MTAEQPSLTITRRLNASPAKIYDAWTRPDQMMRWWSPDAGPTLSAETDVRPGGHFRIVFQMLNGVQRDCSGVYREVEPNRRLVFTWRWAHVPARETLVTVGLRALAEGTELTFTHAQFHDEADRDDHRKGWGGVLDKLEKFLVQPA